MAGQFPEFASTRRISASDNLIWKLDLMRQDDLDMLAGIGLNPPCRGGVQRGTL